MFRFASASRGQDEKTWVVLPTAVIVGNVSRVPFPMSCTVAPAMRIPSIDVVEFTEVQPFTPRTVSTTATITSPAAQFHEAPTSFAHRAGWVPLAGVYESAPVRSV